MSYGCIDRSESPLSGIDGDCHRARANELYVLCSIFNPRRFWSRVDLYKEFAAYVRASGANLFTIEAAFGDRRFEVTEPGDPNCLQLRTADELWHKERMLCLGLHRLPPEAKYVAWVDPDVHFSRHDWATETVHMLQHHPVVQMFGQATNLAPNEEIMWTARGIAKGWKEFGKPVWECAETILRGQKDHPGLAWAFRRDALDAMGGFLDFCIAGSADLHMVGAWSGNFLLGHPRQLPSAYLRALNRWAERAYAVVREDVGYVTGVAFHHWHGRSQSRGYDKRWQIMIDHNFNPATDLMQDTQGMWRWTRNNPRLRAALRQSLSLRHEDGIDV